MPKLGEATLCRLIVLVVVLIVGCSSGDGRTSPQPPSNPVTAAPDTPAATEQEVEPSDPGESPTEQNLAERDVLAAYQGYWQAILEANDPPDEFHPALERYATGEAFESVFDAAQTNRLAGRALRLPEDSVSEHRAEVVSIDGDTAGVSDCAIDDGLVIDVETGEVVNDEVVTRLATATLRRVDGQWKVATTRVEQSCGCQDAEEG